MWESKSVNYRSFRSSVEVWHLHHGTCVLVPFDQGVACGAGNGGILFDCSNIFGLGIQASFYRIQAFIHLIQMGMNRCQRTGHQFRNGLQILFRHGRLFSLAFRRSFTVRLLSPVFICHAMPQYTQIAGPLFSKFCLHCLAAGSAQLHYFSHGLRIISPLSTFMQRSTVAPALMVARGAACTPSSSTAL